MNKLFKQLQNFKNKFINNISTYSNPIPKERPINPEFSSGPCKKRPGWDINSLSCNTLGRSHRSKIGKSKIPEAITKTRNILKIPDNYVIGIVPASDTGAFEMSLWSMLGYKPVDVCYWESFGKGWYTDLRCVLISVYHPFPNDSQ